MILFFNVLLIVMIIALAVANIGLLILLKRQIKEIRQKKGHISND